MGFISDNISGTILYGDGSNLTSINNFVTTAVTLSSNQILRLGNTIEILPSPGNKRYYVIDSIIMEYSYGTKAYIFPKSETFYLNGCFDSYIDKTLLTTESNSVCVVTGNLRDTYQVGTGSGSVYIKTNSDVLNANLVIGTQYGDNPTTGDGTLKLKITYKIETFGS